MDASELPIVGILNQYEVCRVLRPVNVYFRKCSQAQQTCDTDARELLAILKKLQQLGHYLEGAN
jgi:hypothetical protein